MTEGAAPINRTEIWSNSQLLYQLFSTGLEPSAILVCKLDHVGDFCLAFDALFALREAYPAAHIVLACGPWNVDLARALGVFDLVVPVPFFPSRADTALAPFDPACLAPVANLQFDLAIDLRLDPDTRGILDHVKAGLTFGFESDRGRPLTLALPLPPPLRGGSGHNKPGHEGAMHHGPVHDASDLLRHQSLLMLHLVQTVIALIRPPRLMRDYLRQRLLPSTLPAALADLPRPIVAVCTGSGRKAKDWPLTRFREIVDWLHDGIGTSVVLLGTADQLSDAMAIQQSIGSSRVRSLVNQTTLLEALGVVGNVDLFLGNDTGLTHYAARFGVPTIGIFSGIDPTATWAPVGEGTTVLKAPVPCSPCHILHLEDCRNNHECMNGISVAAVKRAIRAALLKRAPWRNGTGVPPHPRDRGAAV